MESEMIIIFLMSTTIGFGGLAFLAFMKLFKDPLYKNIHDISRKGGMLVMIHNADMTVDFEFITHKESKEGSNKLNEKYGLKFAPTFDSVERYNKGKVPIIHYYRDSTNTISPEAADCFDSISKIMQEHHIPITTFNLLTLLKVSDTENDFSNTDSEVFKNILKDANCDLSETNYYFQEEELQRIYEAASVLNEVEVIDRLIKPKTLISFKWQRGRQFLDLIAEANSVMAQLMISEKVSLLTINQGFFNTGNKIDKDMMKKILIAGVVLVGVYFALKTLGYV